MSTSSQRALAAAESAMGVGEAAKRYSVSQAYVSRARMVMKNSPPDVVAAVRNGELTVYRAWERLKSPPPQEHEVASDPVPYTRLTAAQIRRAMARWLGFDVIRDDFTVDLLEQVPHAELLDFMERLTSSRTATENLINEIRKITEKGIST